jgi:hypothetical protein
MNMQEDSSSDTEAALPMEVLPVAPVQPKAHQDKTSFEQETLARAQLGRYARTGMFPGFKFPFSDENFKIDGKPYQHYVKLCGPLVGHTLIGNDKKN